MNPPGGPALSRLLLGSDCFRCEKASQSYLRAKAAPLGFLPQMCLCLSGPNSSMHAQTPKALPTPDSSDSMLTLTNSQSHQLLLKTSLGVGWLNHA